MQNELFTEPKEEFVLFDNNRMRVILRQNMYPSDALISNDWYEGSFCGHLRWIRPDEIKTRSYKVTTQ